MRRFMYWLICPICLDIFGTHDKAIHLSYAADKLEALAKLKPEMVSWMLSKPEFKDELKKWW
jgi:hypothetical protein